MASKRFGKDSIEWDLFQQFWRLCQKFWIPEDNDEYWNSMIKETNEFMKKYQSEIFSKEIGLAFIESLEKKRIEQKGG